MRQTGLSTYTLPVWEQRLVFVADPAVVRRAGDCHHRGNFAVLSYPNAGEWLDAYKEVNL